MTVTGVLHDYIQINTTATEPKIKNALPFVKWAGGKRSILQELVKHLPEEFENYFEPFMGGAALYFGSQEKLKKAFLSDTNLDLALTFRVVQKDPHALIAKLEEHAKKDNAAYFYEIRAQHNIQNPIDIAARFIYLNKTCYNGLYRVNKKGEFNVPRGQYGEGAYTVQKENILACSKALQKAAIEYREFDTIIPTSGDFVYFDPPYYPSDSTSFTRYTKLDFSEKDQERLRGFAEKLTKDGVLVMLSNSDTKFVRKLYSKSIWHIETIRAPRFVNCKPTGRGAVNELLITNYNTFRQKKN